MTCFKGFMQPTPNGPRLTLSQRIAIHNAVLHAVSLAIAGGDARDHAVRIVDAGLDLWPIDRSCATCSYEISGECRNFGQRIPADFYDKGCDAWQDSGAPF